MAVELHSRQFTSPDFIQTRAKSREEAAGSSPGGWRGWLWNSKLSFRQELRVGKRLLLLSPHLEVGEDGCGTPGQAIHQSRFLAELIEPISGDLLKCWAKIPSNFLLLISVPVPTVLRT